MVCNTSVNGINNMGEIVGPGFLYKNGSFTPYGSANGINDLGQIVGRYTDSNGVQVGFLYDPAPGLIPGAGLLSYIALGLLGIGSYGWRRLRAAAA
jgi:probable HAF family extracellular repeat protein